MPSGWLANVVVAAYHLQQLLFHFLASVGATLRYSVPSVFPSCLGFINVAPFLIEGSSKQM